jgi:hypothetical protein
VSSYCLSPSAAPRMAGGAMSERPRPHQVRRSLRPGRVSALYRMQLGRSNRNAAPIQPSDRSVSTLMLRRGDSGEAPRPATAWRAPVAGLGPGPGVGLGHAAPRLSPAPSDPDAPLSGRPAQPRDVPRPSGRGRHPGRRRAPVGRARLPRLSRVRHPRVRVREGAL